MKREVYLYIEDIGILVLVTHLFKLMPIKNESLIGIFIIIFIFLKLKAISH